ncbi:MAG: hypothetical protein CL910_21270 [Deltaproteobacteria bacterium]|nr:hypothetical protein [Deltaproteobacteria bacterium]
MIRIQRSARRLGMAAAVAAMLALPMVATADHHEEAGDNPCAENPCAENPCAENPCAENPCGEAENPCGGD